MKTIGPLSASTALAGTAPLKTNDIPTAPHTAAVTRPGGEVARLGVRTALDGALPPRHANPLTAATGIRPDMLRPSLVPHQPTLDAAILGPGKAKVLVSLEGEHSASRDAELGARQILLSSLESRVRARHPAKSKGNDPLQRFAQGHLDRAFLDARHFAEYAQAMGADAHDEPILLDARHGRLVVNLQEAFAPGDQLSDAGLRALSGALGVSQDDLRPSSSTKGRALAQTHGNDAPIPAYGGKELAANERGGAPFFKPNTHHLIDSANPKPWLNANRHNYTHLDYFNDPAGHNVGRPEISVHRGLIDNAGGIPENSLAAIRSAHEHGFRSIEIDVQVARDGVPILMHDFTAGRMTQDRDNRLVGDIDSSELTSRNLVIRHPISGDFVVTDQKVPTVEQALREVHANMPGMTVALDCKESAPEQAIAMLLDHPELRGTTAIKLYAGAYPGGFDQLLGNLQQQRGIHPTNPQDRERRLALLDAMKEIQLIPILSQEQLKSPVLQRFIPAPDAAPLARKGGTSEAAGLASSGMAWLHSWQAAKPVILEVVQISNDAAGHAMHDIRAQLRRPGSGLDKVPFSGSYRFEDFSIPQKNGGARHFTWNVFGGQTEIDASKEINVRRNTVGSFRHEADNLLTDQPNEELWALGHDKALAQGHSGYELDVPPGTAIDIDRNSGNTQRRTQQFLAAKKKPDAQRIADVARGRAADRRATSTADGEQAQPSLLHTAPGLAAVAIAATGAAAMAYPKVKAMVQATRRP
jgi:hypothetical protein